LGDVAAHLIARGVQNRNARIVDLVGDGKTEEDDLHHRHAQQYQQAAPVAKDVE
jgi:hypothetical protein